MKHPLGRRRKLCPFESLSRKKRGNTAVRLRQRILQNKNMYGGMFTSHLVLNEPGRPALYNQWFDFFFLGQDKFTIWNAFIYTAQAAFWEEVADLARERARKMLSPEEQEKEFKFETEPAEFDAWRKPLTYRMIFRDHTYPQFNDMTYRDYCRQLEREIITTEPPAIHESFKLDHGYEYGIGLHIVVDAEEITQSVIEQAILRFKELGETDWQAATPVPRERLPQKTEYDSMAEVEPWSPWLPVREYSRFVGLMREISQYENALKAMFIARSKQSKKGHIDEAGIGVYSVYKVRNKFAHGSMEFPEPEEYGEGAELNKELIVARNTHSAYDHHYVIC